MRYLNRKNMRLIGISEEDVLAFTNARAVVDEEDGDEPEVRGSERAKVWQSPCNQVAITIPSFAVGLHNKHDASGSPRTSP